MSDSIGELIVDEPNKARESKSSKELDVKKITKPYRERKF